METKAEALRLQCVVYAVFAFALGNVQRTVCGVEKLTPVAPECGHPNADRDGDGNIDWYSDDMSWEDL